MITMGKIILLGYAYTPMIILNKEPPEASIIISIYEKKNKIDFECIIKGHKVEQINEKLENKEDKENKVFVDGVIKHNGKNIYIETSRIYIL